MDMPAVHAMLQRQVEHMVRLIDDLMEVSRISRGVIELDRQALDLVAIVRETVDAARPAIAQAGLRLDLELPPTTLPLEGDKVRLAQVLSNLLSNAIRYTDAGGRIDVLAWTEDGQARVAVSDTGIGIAPDKLPGLFTLFRQIDRRDARSQGGMGIGLSLAQRLAQMHGGRIRAESAGLGHGSRFVLELPLSAHALDAAPAGRPAAATPSPRRVLVVDDNHDAADSTAMLLRASGAEVRVSYDGPSALDALQEWQPDVVLLDVGMPGMDGLEVARRIRGTPEFDGVRLVALTGWGQNEDIARTRASGFDTHLVKPAGMGELMQALDTPRATTAPLPG
jgi:CheY-like chemotaxis protein/two-component sensor histidine kinase